MPRTKALEEEEPMVEDGRLCQKCFEFKPISEFSREPRIESGRSWKCKACEAKDRKKWAAHTREKRRW